MSCILGLRRKGWRALTTLFTVLFWSITTPAVQASADAPLSFAVHPYLPATEIERRFSPLTAYLSQALDRPVALRVSADYAAHIEAVGRDLVDFAYMGPAAYVVMRVEYGPKTLLASLENNGTPDFHGVITVRTDSPVRHLSDLRGKRFAFGDMHSTMGHVMPRHLLALHGVDVSDLAAHAYLESHRNVALAVLLGAYDAGAVKDEIFDDYKARGLRALALTPPVRDHVVIASGRVAAELAAQARDALLALGKKAEAASVLTHILPTATGMAAVTDSDYDSLRAAMEGIGEPWPPR